MPFRRAVTRRLKRPLTPVRKQMSRSDDFNKDYFIDDDCPIDDDDDSADYCVPFTNNDDGKSLVNLCLHDNHGLSYRSASELMADFTDGWYDKHATDGLTINQVAERVYRDN